MLQSGLVAISHGDGSGAYSETPPFRPSETYLELSSHVGVQAEPNAVYGMMRELFRMMHLDQEHFGCFLASLGFAWRLLGRSGRAWRFLMAQSAPPGGLGTLLEPPAATVKECWKN